MAQWNSVSIIIAALNETYSLRETVEKILSLCNNDDIAEIIIVVCKKTTPECLTVANELSNYYSKNVAIKVYCQKKPFVGMAYREAFDLAKGSHAVIMSADLETPPEILPKFIEMAKSSPNVVITASRWLAEGSFDGYSKVKWLCNWIFQKMIAILFLCKNSDLTYGYRIFPVSLLRSIQWKETRHPFFLETGLVPLRLNIPIKEVPAKWKARTEGSSINSFWANFKYFKTALRIRVTPKRALIKCVNVIQP